MAGVYTTTEADGLLKEFYVNVENSPAEQLNNASPVLAQFEASADNISAESDEAVWPIHTGRNHGVFSIAEDDTLPEAGNQQDVKARQSMKTHGFRIKLTKQVMRAARSNRGAFRKATTREMTAGVNDLRRDLGRQVFGTADGVIATCGTTTTSATIVLATTTTATQMRQFEKRMRVDIGTLAAPTTIASNREITAIDRANKTITVSGATVSTTGSHFVFRAGNGGGPGTGQKELTGLQHTVSDSTTLYGLAPGTYDVHAATVDTNGGTARPITLQELELGLATVYEESGYEGKRLGVMSPKGMVAFGQQFATQRRYTGEQRTLRGGYRGLGVYTDHGEADFISDKDCPYGNVFLLALDTWVKNEWQPPGWEDDDGSILHLVSGKLNYEAVYSWMFDIATLQRNANYRGTNFIEPS